MSHPVRHASEVVVATILDPAALAARALTSRLARLAAEAGGGEGASRDFEKLVGEYVEQGDEGLLLLCGAASLSDAACARVAPLLARERLDTRFTMVWLAEDRISAGQRAAVAVLGYWDEPDVVDLLLRIAQTASRSRDVRNEAIASLCRLEAPEAIDLLGRSLEDPHVGEALRCRCAEALGAIGNYGALDALESVLRHAPEGPVAQSARDAIRSIRQSDV